MAAMTSGLFPAVRGRAATDVLAAGIACAAWIVAISRASDILHAIAIGAAGTLLAVIAQHDFRTLKAPNALVLPGLLLQLGVAAAFGLTALAQASTGAVLAFGLMLVIALLGRGAMGLGDVKFAALAGAIVGLRLVLPMLALAFAIGGLVAAVCLGLRLRRRKDVLPFTPLLAIGAISAIAIYSGYLAG